MRIPRPGRKMVVVHNRSCGDRLHAVLVSYLPILTWMPRYQRLDLIYDAVSGVTVALTLMPQAIAYASLAGLDPLVSQTPTDPHATSRSVNSPPPPPSPPSPRTYAQMRDRTLLAAIENTDRPSVSYACPSSILFPKLLSNVKNRRGNYCENRTRKNIQIHPRNEFNNCPARVPIRLIARIYCAGKNGAYGCCGSDKFSTSDYGNNAGPC